MRASSTKPSLHPETLLAQALGWIDEPTDALGPPIRPSTTFLRDPTSLGRVGRTFTRDDNPTFLQVEALLSTLEGGDGAVLFSSGMAAAMATMQLLEPGAHVVVPTRLYSGMRHWLQTHGRRWQLVVTELDYDDLTGLNATLDDRPARLVWIETPANPLWHVSDICGVAAIAHAHGALVVADNTVATPMLTRPIEWGVDIVLHSGSKYLNGHADVVAGALVVAPDQGDLLQRLARLRNDFGSVLGPFEAWLMLRGMRTLHLRVATVCSSAIAIARFLSGHPRVIDVLYPGLESHAGHSLASVQMSGGYGGMLSFRPSGGEDAAHRIAASLSTIRRAISFGGLETVIEVRRGMEGADSRTPPDLLRLSVGVEAVGDLIADLEQALAA